MYVADHAINAWLSGSGGRMELDHVFMLVDRTGPEIDSLQSIGLIETYRRSHQGQGTENVCFCFENLFFECLWISDLDEVRGPVVARTRLYERSRWRTEGTNPFGLAWREDDTPCARHLATWTYAPPYLPPGIGIDVAVESDDPRQPMMFRSPGTSAPATWPPDRKGVLQRPIGLGAVREIRLGLPDDVAPCATLRTLAASTILEIGSSDAYGASLDLVVERVDSPKPLLISLPLSNPPG